LPLSPRLRWKLNQYREQMKHIFGGTRKEGARPKLCPACGTLVGSTATRCHQCGASLTFSLAAASRSLGRLMPATSPATYGILSLCCLIYGASLIATMRVSGFAPPSGGGLSALLDFGAINNRVLLQLGASLPLPVNLAQPWRFVTAIFLHASLLHIGFNMWVLMDIGPMVEEFYGSARYLFLFVITGIGGYVLSSFFEHFSIGASGALLGLIGALFAMTLGRHTSSMQMLRGQMIRWLIYIVIWGLFFPGVDNMAHLGGAICGFALGRIMVDRPPSSAEERQRAYVLGWAAALAVVASFAVVVYGIASHQPM